jgi:hypothetical protein
MGCEKQKFRMQEQSSLTITSFKILYPPVFTYSLTGTRREIPSILQRGRQPRGSIPWPPLLSRFFIDVLRLSHYLGIPNRQGMNHGVLEPPGATACHSLGLQRSPDILKKQLNFFLIFVIPSFAVIFAGCRLLGDNHTLRDFFIKT